MRHGARLRGLLRAMQQRPWLLAALLATALFFWLLSALRVRALFSARDDDALFLSGAASLLRLKWLGGYGVRTLVKGPGYPLFLALCSVLHVPVLWAQGALYAVACALFCVAVRPLLPRPATRFTLYLALLFNPVTFSLVRLLRDAFYAALVLLVFGCALGAYLRRRDGLYSAGRPWLFGFAAGLGVALITREEGIWLAPALLLLALFGLWSRLRDPQVDRPARRRELSAVLVAGLLACLPSAGVAALNAIAYRRFITTEMRAPEFEAANGALMRIRDRHQSQSLYVSRESLRRAARVSSSVRELMDYFEHGARLWTCHRENFANLAACHQIEPDEIPGGWFVWALRSAVEKAGYYDRAPHAAAFYARLASEVNAACAEHQLDCSAPRASLIPPWQADFPRLIALSAARALEASAGFRTPAPSQAASWPSELTGSETRDRRLRVFSDAIAPEHPLSTPRSIRLAIADGLAWLYRKLAGVLLAVAGVFWLASMVRATRAALNGDGLVVASTLAIAVLSRVAVIALVDALSFPAIGEYYLAPAFPLELAFAFITLALALGRVRLERPT